MKAFSPIACLLMISLAGSYVKAQTYNKTFAPEFTLDLPLNSGYSIGVGASAQGQFPIERTGFSILGRAGIDVFFPKKNLYYNGYGDYYSTGTTGIGIPILVGGRYYIADGLHADLEMGVLIGVSSGATTVFDFAPSVGYTFPSASGRGSFDPFVRLSTSFGNGSFFSFGARYQFNSGSPSPRRRVKGASTGYKSKTKSRKHTL